jgi:hypothetical protein
MIRDGTLDDPARRDTFLACVQRFSRAFQATLFARQAFCADPIYYRIFLKHLDDEYGHDRLIARRPEAREMQDTLFEAILSWFPQQMLLLDNVDKAVLVHLVLETAGDYFHSMALPYLGHHVESPYFETHAECDPEHATMAMGLLDEHHESTYRRLVGLVDDGWDMLLQMMGRTVKLVASGATASKAQGS